MTFDEWIKNEMDHKLSTLEVDQMRAAWNASIKNKCNESVLVQGIISSWVISTWLHGQMPKEVRSECFFCWRPVDENGNCEHLEHCIVPLAFKMMPLPEPPKED